MMIGRTSRKAKAFGGFGAKSKISFQVSWSRNVSWLTLTLGRVRVEHEVNEGVCIQVAKKQ